MRIYPEYAYVYFESSTDTKIVYFKFLANFDQSLLLLALTATVCARRGHVSEISCDSH